MEKLSEYQAKERAKAAVWIVDVGAMLDDYSSTGNTGDG